MINKKEKVLASTTVIALVAMSTICSTNVKAASEVTRMCGNDRFITAQTVAKQTFKKSDNVVLVNGLGYADSVSATSLAKLKNAPILLTNNLNTPSRELLETLKELEAKNIFIVGGKSVITEQLENQLKTHYKVERIGGSSRYETNAKIAKKVIDESKCNKVVLVNGQDGYADALSVSSISASKGYPVIFSTKSKLPEVEKSVIKHIKDVLVVGGEGVLNEKALKDITANRIANGLDRFDTNLKILEYFNKDFKFDNIFLASGGNDNNINFADALVASAAAAKYDSPIVLTGLGANEENVKKSVKYVKDKSKDKTKVTLVGGKDSISEDIENQFKEKKEPIGENKVNLVEGVNLNQIKVTFDTKVHSTTATDVKNYELDGVRLSKSNSYASTVDGGKAVMITLSNAQSQEKRSTLGIRKGILTNDKSKLIKEKELSFQFKDLKAPVIKKVETKSNRKVIVEFSESLFVQGEDKAQALKMLAEQLEINNKSISSIGFDESLSRLKSSIKSTDKDKVGFYIEGVEYHLNELLPTGVNKLYIPKGRNKEFLCDAAGWCVKESIHDLKIDKITGKLAFKSIKGSDDGKIYIDFNRPLDKKSLKQCKITLNDTYDIQDKAKLCKSDTQIKFDNLSKIKKGINLISISNKLRDAYNNKLEDEIRVTFNATEDKVKPKVQFVLVTDDNILRVIYSKDVLEDIGKDIKNYTLKDSEGNKVAISKIEKVSKDIYDLILNEKLDGLKYSLSIENIMDSSRNIMDDYNTNIKGSNIAPTIDNVVSTISENVDENGVAIMFNQQMKKSSVDNLDNYRCKDNEDKLRKLPLGSKIKVSKDGKTVKIILPKDYLNNIKAIIVKDNVQSISGIKMLNDEIHYINKLSSQKIKIKDEAMTLKKEGDDVVVRLKYTGNIDRIEDKGNFKFKVGEEEIIPSIISARGDFLEFRFKPDDSKKVEREGVDLQIISLGKVIDFVGESTKTEDLNEEKFKKIYKNEVYPELLYKKELGYISAKDSNEAKEEDWEVNHKDGSITIKFNTKIDESCVNKDNFTFISDKSSNLDIKNVKVQGNTIIYKLTDEGKKRLQVPGKHTIIVKINGDGKRIKSKEDLDGNSNEIKLRDTEKTGPLKFTINIKENKIKEVQ